MTFDNYLELLKNNNELKEIRSLIRSGLQISRINKKNIKKTNKALLFKNIELSKYSVITNLLSSKKRIDFASSQCVYGLNIIKDLFAGVRNIVGGRVKSIEDPLAEAKNTIIEALKEEAYFPGGNAVIGIRIEHTYNNAGAANMVSILGTGTIVKLKV